MKDLVERVSRAMWNRNETDNIIGHKDGDDGWKFYRKDAHRAIRAVLSHFSEPGNVTERMCFEAIQSKFTRNLEFSEWKGKAVLNYQDPIASAMRAALSELQAKEAGE